MKRIFTSICALLLLVMVVTTPAGGMVIEKIIVKVNGEIITSSMVNAELMTVRYQLSQEGKTPQEIEQIIPIQRAIIIDRLIEDKVILLAARARKFDIAEEHINREVNKQVSMTTGRFPSEKEFYAELKKQGKTLKNLKNDYRKDITDELLRQKIIYQEVKSQIDTSDEKVKDYYRQKFYRVSARHILVKSEKEALRIYHQLKDGADFAALAKKHSLDPSASEGGDLGFFSRGMMIPSFEETAFSLLKGEFSKPVRTPFGYHLIKVEEIEIPQDIKPISDSELTKLRQEYFSNELRYRYDQWIAGLKEKAVIEIIDEDFKN